MKYYKWTQKGEGRKIGKIGDYCLYEKTITEEKCEENKPNITQTYGHSSSFTDPQLEDYSKQ